MEWKDINIKQYQDLCKEVDEDYADDLERSIGILATLTDKSISYYTDEIPLKKLKEKLMGLAFIKEQPKPQKIHSKIRIGKKRYRFNLNMRNISAGQYIDLTELVKDKEKINDNLHTFLAVLCEEITWYGKKKDTIISDRAKYIQENMRMPMVFSLSGFFLLNYQRLIKSTNDYLESQMKKMTKKAQEATDLALLSIGDGIIL
jgi:hypothetical protein